MASNVYMVNHFKEIFYAPTMRCLAGKLRLLGRSVSSLTLNSKLEEASMLPASNWPHDPDFPLPGNVNVDPKCLEKKAKTFHSQEKYQSLASALFQLESETFRKHKVLTQFLAEQFENDVEKDVHEKNKVECKVQSCPATLRKGFQALFSDFPSDSNDFTIITICQQTKHDMSTWSEDVEEERDTLTAVFIENAQDICRKVQEAGYWADFIDPSSGHAYHGGHRNETLFETDDRFNQLGFQVEDLGCCKVLQHKLWKSNVFVGIIFTTAPVESHVFDNI